MARLIALALTSGCVRFGYDVPRVRGDQVPDASQSDGAIEDATSGTKGAVGGTGGTARDAAAKDGGAGREAGGAGAAAGSGFADAGGAGSDAEGAGGAGSDSAGAGRAGSDAADASGAGSEATVADGGADSDEPVGDTGLYVSDILGFYTGLWGDMVLRKQGNEIWGVYQYVGGTIVGELGADGVFTGWWSQLPTRVGLDAGEVEFRWSRTSGNGITLDGRWRYGTVGDWIENWDVDMVTDGTAPSELTAYFDSPSYFIRHP